MTLHNSVTTNDCVGVCLTSSPKGLVAIRDAECSAAIWTRAPLPRVQNWIDQLDPAVLPRAKIMLRAEMVADAIADLADAYGLPNCEERRMLMGDIAALAAMFSRIMESRYIRLQLQVSETDARQEFHIDPVTARLICTYRGHGTQYGNGTLGDSPLNVHTVPMCSPVILRGSAWPSAREPGLLHRSPPSKGIAEARLVLVLDPIPDIEADDAQRHIH